MEPTLQERDLARWAYFVSFASLGLGLPIPFLSLVSGVIFHLMQHRKSSFVAFHSWQALLLGLLPSVVVGVWSFWGLGIFFDFFMSSGNLNIDLAPFWWWGAAAAVLLTLEVVWGLHAAAGAQRGEKLELGPLGILSRRLTADAR